jgi:hypothetical protein
MCMLEKEAARALKNDTRILCDDLITVSDERPADDKASAQSHRASEYADVRMWDEGTRSWPR